MAHGIIILTPGAATFPDGSSGNLGAGMSRRQGTESNPKKHFLTLDFDGAGAMEHAWWTFPLPDDYASGGKIQIYWMANATSGVVKFQARVGQIGPGDSDTPIEHAQAAAATITDNVNTVEARRMTRTHIDLTMDGAIGDDLIFLVLFRDSADAADTCTVDAEVMMCYFLYTTA